MQLAKMTPTGKPSNVQVSDDIFGLDVTPNLLSQAVRVFLSNQRQGTAQVKTRSEVHRTKKKLYKQKGTGGARHGARSAPIFVGGGVAHGPTGLQNWSRTLSKKQRKLALCQAFSLLKEKTIVSDMPLELGKKTKHAAEFLKAAGADHQQLLLVADATETQVFQVFRNIQGVQVTVPEQITTYYVLSADRIIFTSLGLEKLETRLLATKEKISPVSAVSVAETQLVKTSVVVTKKTVSSKKVNTKVPTPIKATASKKNANTAKVAKASKVTTNKPVVAPKAKKS